MKKSEREFDRNDRNKSYNFKEKYREKLRHKKRNRFMNDKNKKKFKVKTYLTQQDCNDNDSNDDVKELNYFDSDYENFDDFENTILINNVILFEISCRRCHRIFSSNNQFHKHLRSRTCYDMFKKANAFFNAHDNAKSKIFLISFNVNSNQNIDTNYDFRKWQYYIAKVNLSKIEDFFSFCINIEAEITLTDETFFEKQSKNVAIRTMTTFITIRDLEVNKYQTDKYAIVFMYFEEKNKIDDIVKTVIIREIHLIKNLKINLLIENDILEFELIDISTFTNIAYIESCDVTISIIINVKFRFQHMSVHVLRTTSISFKSKRFLKIHNIILSERNYLFESFVSVNFAIYAHVINSKTKSVLVQDDNEDIITVSRNFRLNTLNEIIYFSVYAIDTNYVNLALRFSLTIHKTVWFNKMFIAYTAATSSVIHSIKSEITLSCDVIVHESFKEAIMTFSDFINDYFKLWIDQEFVERSKDNWMRIFLKTNWEKSIKDKVKIYFLSVKNKVVLDEIFDDFQSKNKFSWTTNATFFSFFCFVIWRNSSKVKKNRVMINVRELIAITQSDAYFVFLQSNIIQAVNECSFIFVIDFFEFFYQWRVHSTKRYKFTVVTHRKQKSFNVVVMNFRNSSTYVQKQIDRIFRLSKNFAKAYIDDIVIFSKSLKQHLTHLRKIFDILKTNNISIKFIKSFIEYFSVFFLDQHVNSFDFVTDDQKLKAIVKLIFSTILKQLKAYLKLTDWFRDYIENYATKSKSLQERKINLLKKALLFERIRKTFTSKTRLLSSIFNEIKFFRILQKHSSSFFFLNYFDHTRQFYIDFDTSKKNEIDAMIYHVSSTSTISREEYSQRTKVQFILFLSRLLSSAKIRYWSIELKIVEFVWVLRKIRHLIESFKLSTIVYIDHEVSVEILKQTNFSTSFIDKLNLRLIRASEYIQRFC